MFSFYEFFAGGGMARAGLGSSWNCLFANDFDHKKAKSYQANWGNGELKVSDVHALSVQDIPDTAHLAWASFPCQDLSLAGGGAGLRGERSGTFRPFWDLMKQLVKEGRPPRLVVLENVCGALTSHDGRDFATLCGSLADAGYFVGAVVIDASLFVPQSRARLFVVGVKDFVDVPLGLTSSTAVSPWHTPALLRAHEGLPQSIKERWIWWNMPLPSPRREDLASVIDDSLDAPPWFSEQETARLLQMMAPLHRAKIDKAILYGRRIVGSIYKRTRPGDGGGKHQRAEVRFDSVSGCLRTPAGGSSRQLIIVVENKRVRVRLISARETARLMGLHDEYVLPHSYNEAYHLTGDGVAVPAVRYLAQHLLEPLASASIREVDVAA